MSGSVESAGTQPPTLVDLLDRLPAGGVVPVGEIIISVAGVELVRISLRALIAAVDADQDGRMTAADHDGRR